MFEMDDNRKVSSIYIPVDGDGVYIISDAFDEGTQLDPNLFKEMKEISEKFGVKFDHLLKHKELFEVVEIEWSQEIFWQYQCDIELLLDVLIPSIREERFKKLLE